MVAGCGKLGLSVPNSVAEGTRARLCAALFRSLFPCLPPSLLRLKRYQVFFRHTEYLSDGPIWYPVRGLLESSATWSGSFRKAAKLFVPFEMWRLQSPAAEAAASYTGHLPLKWTEFAEPAVIAFIAGDYPDTHSPRAHRNQGVVGQASLSHCGGHAGASIWAGWDPPCRTRRGCRRPGSSPCRSPPGAAK